MAVAHTGAHEPGTLGSLEHLHGQRDLLLAPDGAVERWRPDAIIDTFAGGATAEKAQELGALAERIDAGHLVAVSPRSASSAWLVGVLKQQMPCQVGRIGVAKT